MSKTLFNQKTFNEKNITNSNAVTDININTTNATITNATITNLTNAELQSATAGVAENASDISSLQSSVSTNASDIATNASNISTNTSAIATNTSDIATNTSNIATNTSAIATNTSNIATNTSNIATNTSDIATNTSNIATNTSDIATNTSAIATNTSDIATNTSAIATNTSNIATNTSAIATNTSNIATNTSDIATNASDITSLQNNKQDNLTAGTGIDITSNVISTTGTSFTAGDGIDITSGEISVADTIPKKITIEVDDTAGQLLVKPSSNTGQDGKIVIRGQRNGTTAQIQSSLLLQNNDVDSGVGIKSLGEIGGVVSNHTSNIGGLVFYNFSNGTTRNTAMTINNNGRVHIGTSFDNQYKLKVTGNTYITGSLRLGSTIDIEQEINDNASAIATNTTNISTNTTNISTNTTDITNLQNNKQNNLTTGEGIDITSNEISFNGSNLTQNINTAGSVKGNSLIYVDGGSLKFVGTEINNNATAITTKLTIPTATTRLNANLVGTSGTGVTAVTNGEYMRLSGVTSNIQTQINNNATAIATNTSAITTNTSNISTNTTAIATKLTIPTATTRLNANLVGTSGTGVTAVTNGEYMRLSGVTSNIQTQINSKQDNLTAGDGINISGTTISVASTIPNDTTIDGETFIKQGLILDPYNMGTTTFTGGGNDTNTDASSRSNTYIKFAPTSTVSSDWCYLRNIGTGNAGHLTFDFFDDANDTRFSIRNIKSTDNPDTITEVFDVNSTGITAHTNFYRVPQMVFYNFSATGISNNIFGQGNRYVTTNSIRTTGDNFTTFSSGTITFSVSGYYRIRVAANPQTDGYNDRLAFMVYLRITDKSGTTTDYDDEAAYNFFGWSYTRNSSDGAHGNINFEDYIFLGNTSTLQVRTKLDINNRNFDDPLTNSQMDCKCNLQIERVAETDIS